MAFIPPDINKKLEEIQNYIDSARKSLKNEDFIAPQGHLYMIKEISSEIIRELKEISPDL